MAENYLPTDEQTGLFDGDRTKLVYASSGRSLVVTEDEENFLIPPTLEMRGYDESVLAEFTAKTTNNPVAVVQEQLREHEPMPYGEFVSLVTQLFADQGHDVPPGFVDWYCADDLEPPDELLNWLRDYAISLLPEDIQQDFAELHAAANEGEDDEDGEVDMATAMQILGDDIPEHIQEYFLDESGEISLSREDHLWIIQRLIAITQELFTLAEELKKE